jgi:DtxR family transcriptional regulator, Mn-dependent transcriptional regulator
VSPATLSDSLTQSVEDYLKAIYQLTPEGRPASTSDIAHRLALSAPSVTGMVKRLSEQGLLEHVPYRGVQLTDEGRRAALRMVRRHRLIEAYLVEFLGYSWDTVHAEAERLEHAVSDTLVERMASALGNPEVDPHGDPIPSADGYVHELSCTPLSEVPVGESVEIQRVHESQPERLRYIASLGIKPGIQVTVIDRQPFDDLVTIDIAGRRHVIGRELSHVLQCGCGRTV